MIISEIIWLRQFADKIERKHDVTLDEVDETLKKQPSVRKIGRVTRKGEDLYRTIGQTDAGRYLAIFFIYKKRGRALVISARDADPHELRNYAKQKSTKRS